MGTEKKGFNENFWCVSICGFNIFIVNVYDKKKKYSAFISGHMQIFILLQYCIYIWSGCHVTRVQYE